MDSIRGLIQDCESLSPRSKLFAVLLALVGFWYPLAGILLSVFFSMRGSRRVSRLAPLAGAIISLALFTVQFVIGSVSAAQ